MPCHYEQEAIKAATSALGLSPDPADRCHAQLALGKAHVGLYHRFMSQEAADLAAWSEHENVAAYGAAAASSAVPTNNLKVSRTRSNLASFPPVSYKLIYSVSSSFFTAWIHELRLEGTSLQGPVEYAHRVISRSSGQRCECAGTNSKASSGVKLPGLHYLCTASWGGGHSCGSSRASGGLSWQCRCTDSCRGVADGRAAKLQPTWKTSIKLLLLPRQESMATAVAYFPDPDAVAAVMLISVCVISGVAVARQQVQATA